MSAPEEIGDRSTMAMLLRSIFDQNREQNGKLEKLGDKLDTLKESVLKLQALEINQKLDALDQRLTSIEATEQKRSGERGLWRWLHDAAPLWISAATAAWALFVSWGSQKH